jgi:AcrR family transcriptional regulator
MPRRSVAAARRTREAIVARAADIASAEGLDGVTIGRLADDMAMSKAGVVGHFGSKEGLQLAVVRMARDRFEQEIKHAVTHRPAGLERLLAMCDAWLVHSGRGYPGGCFWAAAATDFAARPGPVRDAIVEVQAEWNVVLKWHLRKAISNGEVPEDTDVDQAVFELRSIGLGLNQELRLHGNTAAERRARRAVRRIVGRPDLPTPRVRRLQAA